MKANLEMHIDELVFDGLPDLQRDLIAGMVEAELQRLLNDGGLPTALSGGVSLAEMQVDSLQVSPGARADDLGVRIAGLIYTTLTGSQDSYERLERSRNG
jgi:hypothetical protein